ncbi:hypothetical protein H2248_003818 [Termitomyces sp. 'cryptogamus']|nr:hypothetical protein H2248_003818 [Termitomyces sp. 'cryptogamus']
MSSRPPPLQDAPPSYAFVTRVYRRNLRPIVIFTAFLGGLFGLVSGIGWFRNFSVDRNENVPKVANISIALGVLYMVVFVIELFGIYSAATQRLKPVRIYCFLVALATLIVVAASLTRVVSHFVLKNDLLKECNSLTANDEIVYFGFWGPVSTRNITSQEAAQWCRNAWDHDSWAEILALIILGILGALFTAVAFAYYRQLLDPSSFANASRAPSHQVRFGSGYPNHYNPPFYGYNGPQQYAPPPGPPPGHDETFMPPYDSKPPVYHGHARGYSADSKNPFSDFQGSGSRRERDVTSRPYPGGSESFYR